MIQIDKKLIQEIFDKAVVSERKRMNYDLRTSSNDGSQRMLNALMPGTVVPIHRHPHSNENVLCLCGKLVEVLYEEVSEPSAVSESFNEFQGKKLRETERIPLDPSVGNFGCVVPAGVWHTVEVLEPSVIYEAKDGQYGHDGSETYEEFFQSSKTLGESVTSAGRQKVSSFRKIHEVSKGTIPDNCISDLKQQITYLIGMERQSGSMDNCTSLYISRMLNVPLEEVEKVMNEMNK